MLPHSFATLEVPALGYGVRYEFGIFDQTIRDGWQVERTDKWLNLGYPWKVARPERAVEVMFGGYTERYVDERGRSSGALASERSRQRRPARHAHPGLSGQHL